MHLRRGEHLLKFPLRDLPVVVLVEDLEGRPHGALLHQVLAFHRGRQELRVVDLPAAVLVQLRGQQVQLLAAEPTSQARLAPQEECIDMT